MPVLSSKGERLSKMLVTGSDNSGFGDKLDDVFK